MWWCLNYLLPEQQNKNNLQIILINLIIWIIVLMEHQSFCSLSPQKQLIYCYNPKKASCILTLVNAVCSGRVVGFIHSRLWPNLDRDFWFQFTATGKRQNLKETKAKQAETPGSHHSLPRNSPSCNTRKTIACRFYMSVSVWIKQTTYNVLIN